MSFVGMVRGAAPVEDPDPAALERATQELCTALLAENHVRPEDVVSAIFTVTPDLAPALPVRAARQAGWGGVPLFSARAKAGLPPGIVEVEAYVRLRRNRRLRAVLLGNVAERRPDLAVYLATRRPRRTAPESRP